MTQANRLCTGVLVLTLAGVLGACAGSRKRETATLESTQPAAPVSVVLDGNIDEWPPEAAGVADGRYIYVRFAVENEQFSLEAANKSLTIYLDTDGNTGTGLSGGTAPIPEAAGADVEIQFSPRAEDGSFKQGVSVQTIDRSGKITALKPAAADFTFAPTYAAGWYEARLSRRLAGADRGTSKGVARVRGVVVLADSAGRIDGYADPFEIALPPLATKDTGAAEIPATAPGSVRVMSYNVFKGRAVERPEAFARIFRALSPDIVLLQEWEKGDLNEIKAWFVTLVPSASGWQAVRAAGGDVAIVSRFPLTTLGPDNLQLPASGGKPHEVHFVAATATTPAGEVIVGSAHLKCCGGLGGPEEATRLAEAQAINAALKQALTGKKVARVVGGDLNLVATRTPMEALAAGLDTAGGNLNAITAPVLGDPSVFYTWLDPSADFAPGRLDYILLSESAAQSVQSFVLDTSRLTDAALSRYGLKREDSRQSDHLPVVTDVVPRSP